MERLIVCKTEDGRFAVRPVTWAGIWGKNGLLTSGCNSLAYFDDEQDAGDYVAYRASGLTPDELPRAAELVKADEDGRCVVLPCKRQELMDMLSDLEAVGAADEVETYKTGYRNGYRNGRIELLRYVFGLPDGTRAEAEAALQKGEGGQ